MIRYIIRRLLISIPVLLMISFLTFVLMSLSPMDPAEVVLKSQGVPVITDELREETREDLGFNQPFLLQYGDWLLDCLRLDFGTSFVTGQPVWSLLGPALINTVKLTLISSVAVMVLSVLLGVICALQQDKAVDQFVRGISFFLTAMPSYLLASLLIWYFSVKLDLFPTNGMDSYTSYILPVLVITISYAGIYFRVVRSSMLRQLSEDYVLYARACGLKEWRVTVCIIRNSLQVAISVFCMAVPIILGSTVVVESVFAWPGVGSLSIRSIVSRDFPVVQAYVLIVAVAFVMFNAISDILNAAMNPRVRNDH
ncbi:nickel/cobalt ABC transporter permease [Rossellomorea aquimaris]|uniref:nickel/cobalt ABC transporter permease n=1 Tax=Bacillaceae TaxID=186817 RepID=UPI0011EF6AD0|nr:nickel/cobalt ABC transporter permease [Bacillus sp. CH30_1T]KAA0561723.1 ABC transporter permease [Bacillus sp. CH30_1T]